MRRVNQEFRQSLLLLCLREEACLRNERSFKIISIIVVGCTPTKNNLKVAMELEVDYGAEGQKAGEYGCWGNTRKQE